MYTDKIANKYIKDLISRYPILKPISKNLNKTYITLKTCFINDNILFCAGNGGSAADAEHITGELMKGFLLPRSLDKKTKTFFKQHTNDNKIANKLQMGLRCISLISHPALNTAYMNDVDPLMIFAQQLFVLGRSGDVVIGISTSGNAKNICNMFKIAKACNITTILLTGKNPGLCEPFADIIIHVPETKTYKIQELHLPIYHCLCAMLEEYFYKQK